MSGTDPLIGFSVASAQSEPSVRRSYITHLSDDIAYVGIYACDNGGNVYLIFHKHDF